MFEEVQWRQIFSFDTPVIEIILRGTVMYLALFLLLRGALKREAGAVSITDLLVVVLIADAAQNAMSGDYKSVPDGLLLVGTIIFWSFFLNWLGFRFPTVEKLVHPPPLPLIKDGRLIRENLRRELLTVNELESLLREQGVQSISDVKLAFMEGDGRVSVVRKDGGEVSGPREVQF